MYTLFVNPEHIMNHNILADIELAIEDEATLEFSELVGPNSIEYDLGIDAHIERRIDKFHNELYTSIITEMTHHV